MEKNYEWVFLIILFLQIKLDKNDKAGGYHRSKKGKRKSDKAL